MVKLSLDWHGDMKFSNSEGSPAIQLHSSTPGVASPPQALAYGVMACMAMDVVHILQKGRHDVKALKVVFEGQRAEEHPRRFIAMHIRFDITGNPPDEAVARAREARQEEAAVLEQRARLEQLLEENRALADKTADGVRQTQALAETVARAAATRDGLVAELASIERRQRETVAQTEAAEDQIKRAEALFRGLEQRRAELRLADKNLGAVERRLGDLDQATALIDGALKTLAERQAVVDAVRQAVDAVHEVSARSKADFEFVVEHRDEIAMVRHRVDALLATAADAEDKIATIESRRKTIDAVHVKANLIANLLEDVRVNLETLGEQKAVVEHVAVTLARLEFVMQEAQNTLRTLQHERELAERIEQSITQIRSRTALPPEGKIATA